jgi:hypothetical protein
MGYKEITLKLSTGYEEGELKKNIKKELGISDFSYQIENKSLDARKKSYIHWLVRIAVMSDQITEPDRQAPPTLDIPFRKRDEKIVVVGSGPAGFFPHLFSRKPDFP